MPDDAGDDGRLVEIEGRRALRFIRRYPVPPTVLWAAITQPDRMARWAFRGELEPRSGGTLRFDYGEAGGTPGTSSNGTSRRSWSTSGRPIPTCRGV